jgi:thiol:disulfide interchange protein
MKELIRELMRNQITCALLILSMIVVGALIKLDAATAKDVVIQVITAVCALVTGQVLDNKNKRSTDITQTDSTTKTETTTTTGDKPL